MFKKILLTGIVGAIVFIALTSLPMTSIISTSAYAASKGCLPASLKHRLNQIRKKFGPVKVISTHRPGARIAGSGKPSYHASCRAVDFHPPKGKYRAVVSWLKKVHKGGVGTYSCGMRHIHIDNGPRIRYHKCVNRYGSRIGKSKKKQHYARKKYKKPTYSVGRNDTYTYIYKSKPKYRQNKTYYIYQ